MLTEEEEEEEGEALFFNIDFKRRRQRGDQHNPNQRNRKRRREQQREQRREWGLRLGRRGGCRRAQCSTAEERGLGKGRSCRRARGSGQSFQGGCECTRQASWSPVTIQFTQSSQLSFILSHHSTRK